jgi:hypothetical protein
MDFSNQKVITIKQTPEQKKLSKAQKQFNSYIKKIAEQKQLLVDWNDIIPAYNKKITEEYQVIMDNYNAKRIVLAQLLDRAYEDRQFKKKDKNKLAYIVEEIVSSLITRESSADIKALYNKYTESDFDTDRQEAEAEAADILKSMAETLFDMELPDDFDMSSPENIQAAMAEKLLEQEQIAKDRANKRKKSPKQLEKEAKLKEQEQNISKSIQEVYRKLVKTLHPDREQDPTERQRKTEMIQRVNIAYAKKDLLQLLELQLEIEQIDQSQLNNISEDRLKHYNKILREQLDELDQEIEYIELPFKAQLGMSPFIQLSPNKLINYLDVDIKNLKKSMNTLKNDIAAFHDFNYLKSFLQNFKIPKRSNNDLFDEIDMRY